MNHILMLFHITSSVFLIAIALYAAVYFMQIVRVERQFGLALPTPVKRVLVVLTLLPMGISLIVLAVVVTQLLFLS